jgi:hypothetical protein
MDANKFPTALSLFKAIYRSFNIHAELCPGCKAKWHLKFHSEYGHNLVDYIDNSLQQGNRVSISRVLCMSCGKTLAVLPDLFVPRKSYCILFILKVLNAYYHRTESVAALCERYEIAVTTLYVWKKRYITHKTINLGKLAKYFYPEDPHLSEKPNICFTSFLRDFFYQFGFSFLQFSKALESSP